MTDSQTPYTDAWLAKRRREDSQAGDELDTLLEQIASDSGFYEDADFRHIHPKAKVAIADYAERLATKRELYGRLHQVIELFQGGYLSAGTYSKLHNDITERIASLTKADTDEDGDPVQHTTWRKQA